MNIKLSGEILLLLILTTPCHGAEVYGRIIFGAKNMPVEKAEVVLECNGHMHRSYTDAAGQYAATTDKPGHCILRVKLQPMEIPITTPVYAFRTRTRANFFMGHFDGQWLLIRR